jgi:antitoxin component YwqK of YwqJK toxin-antitoxin module
MGWCQDANTPQEAYSCERPQFMDIKDRHRNCRDMYNRKMGLWKTYSYSRVLIAETNYDNDKKHGLCKRYYPHTGALMESCEYHYGVRDGEFKNFYYSGTPKTEGNYVMGKMDGMWTKFFLAGGEVASEGMYSKGKKVGLWKFYNSKGELVKTIGYGREGEVTSVNGQNVEPGTVIIPSDIQPGQLSKNPNQKTPGSSPKISGSVVPNGSGTGSHDTQAPPKGKPKIK